MRFLRLSMTLLVSLGLLSGCGFTDSGSGTDTMRVNVMVSYKFGGSEQSLCTASVNTPGGLPVTDATIVLSNGDDTELVTLTPVSDEDGTYVGSFAGYEEKLYLSITSPQDGNLEAALQGPTRHIIASPQHSSVVSRSSILDGLKVTWDAEHGIRADEVVLRVPEKTEGFGDSDDDIENYVYQSGSKDDTGSGVIPGDTFTDTESIQVLRRNTTVLSGGYEGSLFGTSYLVENQIAVD